MLTSDFSMNVNDLCNLLADDSSHTPSPNLNKKNVDGNEKNRHVSFVFIFNIAYAFSLIALNGSSFDRKIISNKRSTDRMSSMSIRSRSTLTCLHLLFLVRSLFNRWLSSWFNEHQRYSINELWSSSIINWWWTSILNKKKTMASGDEEEEEDLAKW